MPGIVLFFEIPHNTPYQRDKLHDRFLVLDRDIDGRPPGFTVSRHHTVHKSSRRILIAKDIQHFSNKRNALGNKFLWGIIIGFRNFISGYLCFFFRNFRLISRQFIFVSLR